MPRLPIASISLVAFVGGVGGRVYCRPAKWAFLTAWSPEDERQQVREARDRP